MQSDRIKKRNSLIMLFSSILGGVVVNVCLGFFTHCFKLPLYLDTIGTIGVASVAGGLPALFVALFTNIICAFFNPNAIYYSIISILIAIIAGAYLPKRKSERTIPVILVVIIFAAISGVIGAIIQLVLLGEPQFIILNQVSTYLTSKFIGNFSFNFILGHFLLNIVDKGICVYAVIGVVYILPEENCDSIAKIGWKQSPLTKQQIKDYSKSDARSGHLQKRITGLIVFAALLITVLLVWISLTIFWDFASTRTVKAENIYLMKQYLLRITMIFSGYLVFILYAGVWVAKYYLVYPMNAIASATANLMNYTDNETISKEYVDNIKALDIGTKDELEFLYHAICKMAEDSMNQMNDIKYQAKAINQMQTGLIITMADMVENRDKDTGYHIQKTADYVKIIVEGLKKKGYYKDKITPKYISDVVLSAPLHDIGKINIPDAILNKPGKLTDEEFAIMKTHAEDGRKIIEKAIKAVKGENYLKEARNMAGYHHEKWDGTGYPEGLKGQVIPLSARIMAVADVFDALSSKRVYKDAMPFEDALAILQKDSGTHFDPKCVEVFIDAKDEVLQVMEKYKE